MIMYVRETTSFDYTTSMKGWGNGYVIIDFSHPYWGLSSWDAYGEENQITRGPLNVHGGITAERKVNKDGWIPDSHWEFGFDTAHSGDTLETWPKERVELETKELFCQLMEIETGEL